MAKYPTVHMNEFKRLLKAANPTVESGLSAKELEKLTEQIKKNRP